jgi:hypothetical protein
MLLNTMLKITLLDLVVDAVVGDDNFKWQVDLRGGDDNHLTWSNLLINGNFNRFIDEMVPLFGNKKVVFIGNETLDLSKLPFKIEKDFRVGNNCAINNFNISNEIIEWIKENNIKDYLFLLSAASLSEVLIHKLFVEEKENTYIDVGTGLNLYLVLIHLVDIYEEEIIKCVLVVIRRIKLWIYTVK